MDARSAISQWITVDYNERYVHSTLGYKRPLEFEATLRGQEALTPLRLSADRHVGCLTLGTRNSVLTNGGSIRMG
jgi:hypothetical protein